MVSVLKTIINKLSNKQVLLLVFIISLALYGNTLWNDYALDDAIVITKNEFTKQGISGIKEIFLTESFTGFFGVKKDLVAGGRYRPLSIATFALEYDFFGEAPGVSHFINLCIYALIGWLVYLILQIVLVNKFESKLGKTIALLTSLLFVIHPIHTEVVANIKGRDELLSLFFVLVSFYLIIKPIKRQWINSILIIISFLFALLSKENAIAFVFIIPAAIWYFKIYNLKKILRYVVLLFAPVIVFLVIRHNVLGGLNTQAVSELMNNPFVNASPTQKYATVFYTWILYFKLLIVPHPLTFDYYPYHIPVLDFGSFWVWMSLIVFIGLLIVFVLGLKKRSILSFAIISFAAAFVLMSNLFFSVGTFMNERFVFVASLFWCLALVCGGAVLAKNNNKLKPIIYMLGLYMLVFYPYKTIARNTDWKNDFTLFTTDVKTSANSAKSNCSAGGKLWEKGKVISDKQKRAEYYQLSEKYLRKALDIHPTYTDAWLLLGNVLFDSKNAIAEAAECYLWVLNRNPNHENAFKNIDIILQQSKDYALQKSNYEKLLKLRPNDYLLNYRLGLIYARYMNNLHKGINYLEIAEKLNEKDINVIKDLGTAYGMSGQTEKAYIMFKKAVAIDSTDHQMFINLGVASRQLGKLKEAQEYFKKAEKIRNK